MVYGLDMTNATAAAEPGMLAPDDGGYSTVAGGGSNGVVVFSNGSSWLIL